MIEDCSNIDGVNINVVSKDEHVENLERYIHVAKERAQCCWSMLPFEKILKGTVVHPMLTVLFYVNDFPMVSGIFDFYVQ